MGCCPSRQDDDHLVVTHDSNDYYVESSGSKQPARRRNEPSAEEKRQAAAKAAEARQKNWRQGGSIDPAQSKRLKERREKDELIGKIEAGYKLKGETPPFGLSSCEIDTLKKHLERI